MVSKKDLCVIGIGKFGDAIVRQLLELKRFVLAIDISEERLKQVSRVTKTIVADAEDIDALRSIGISEFETVIVGASNNVEIISALKELGVKHIIAKAKSIGHERVLKQIGVDVIIKPEAEAGIRTALIATNINFIKYSESLQEIGDGYVVGSTIVNDIEFLGKRLKDLNLNKMGISVVSINRASKVHLPDGKFILKMEDIVTIIGKITNVTKAFAKLNDAKEMTKSIKIPLEKSNKNKTQVK